MLIAGIDPGLDGAICFMDASACSVVAIIGMPTLTLAKGKGSKREISARTLAIEIGRQLDDRPVGHAFLERVASSPQMGVTSAFNFGRGYGVIEGIIAGLGWPLTYVTPQKWKAFLGVPRDKDDARAKACQLLAPHAELWTPRRGVFDSAQASGRAEAALIALYGCRTLHSMGAAA
jgi:crossover junction endodeoxyribonuclease RuvC